MRDTRDTVDDSERTRFKRFLLPDAEELASFPSTPENPLTPEKVRLGRLLFHDPLLHTRPLVRDYGFTVSCATCHYAGTGFQAGARQGLGEGGVGFAGNGAGRTLDPSFDRDAVDAQMIRTPSTLHGAWLPTALWNGQLGAHGANSGTESLWRDEGPTRLNRRGWPGLETQALAGLAVHRLSVEHDAVRENERYQALFAAAFPSALMPITDDNAALAIAAFERTLVASEAPFQRWLRGDSEAMTSAERRGMNLFFGPAGCVRCHDQPGFGGDSFHALGMADLDGEDIVVTHDFSRSHLGRGGFTDRDEDLYCFKVPQLYNLRDAGFFGHGASFTSIRDVIEYKVAALPENEAVPLEVLSPSFRPLALSARDIDDLVSFVEDALYDPTLHRFLPTQEELPSGLCPVNDDAQSRDDRGCNGAVNQVRQDH